MGCWKPTGHPSIGRKTFGSASISGHNKPRTDLEGSMRRAVVTGMGIVSSIGNNTNEVLASLREAKPRVVAAPEYAELGFPSQVHAQPHIEWETMVDRRAARFLAQGTAF